MSGVGGIIQVIEGKTLIVVDVLQLGLEIARNLSLIDPDVQIKIRMREVDTGIDHTDNHRLASLRDVPRRRGVHVGIGRHPELPDVVQADHVGELGVIRSQHSCDRLVRRIKRQMLVLRQRDRHVIGR